MFYDDLFGPWGRIVVILIGAVICLTIILFIACFLTPGCIGYECIRKRKTDVTSFPQPTTKEQKNERMKLGDISYRSWRIGSLYENGSNGTIPENQETQTNTVNSNNPTIEPVEATSTLTLIHTEKSKHDKKQDFPTELTFSLQYLPPCNEIITGKLVIGIEALSGLPPKQYNCTLEPYVALNIMKQSWSHRKRRKLHSFRTRGIRHTASPIYKETFIVADVQLQEAKEWVLDIAANDHDRYANHTELGSLKLPLKEVKKIFQSPEIHMFNYRMKPSNLEFGNILLGISYLPTAQRLTINVMKLRDIKFLPTVPSIQEFKPYVRVLMLNGKTGKKLKKKRTKVLQGASHPEFNETLIFDLTCDQLDNVQFLTVLCSKMTAEEPCNTIDQPSDSEDSVTSRRSKDVFIGKVALGKGVRGPTERLHWFSVLQNPRKLVTVWHTLK